MSRWMAPEFTNRKKTHISNRLRHLPTYLSTRREKRDLINRRLIRAVSQPKIAGALSTATSLFMSTAAFPMEKSSQRHCQLLLQLYSHAAAHEMRNALAVISNEIHILNLTEPRPEYANLLNRLREANQVFTKPVPLPLSSQEKFDLSSTLAGNFEQKKLSQIIQLVTLALDFCFPHEAPEASSSIDEQQITFLYQGSEVANHDRQGSYPYLTLYAQHMGSKMILRAVKLDNELMALGITLQIEVAQNLIVQISIPREIS